MKFRVRAKPKAEMQWYKGNQKIHEDSKFKSKYIELGNDEYEVLLEILVRNLSINLCNYQTQSSRKTFTKLYELKIVLPFRNQQRMMVVTTNV